MFKTVRYVDKPTGTFFPKTGQGHQAGNSTRSSDFVKSEMILDILFLGTKSETNLWTCFEGFEGPSHREVFFLAYWNSCYAKWLNTESNQLS